MQGIQKLKIAFLSCVFLITFDCSAKAETALPPKPGMINQSRQLVVVVTDSWNNVKGSMQTFERANTTDPWHATGPAWPVVVGQNGLGWDDNLKSYADSSNPIKQEGDQKAPAGAFRLGPAFGFAASADSQLKLPYIPVTAATICVDDPKSRYYGKIIDSSKVPAKDWNSAENMREQDPQYQRGIVVDYNTDGKMLGAGSCIFIHIHGVSDDKGTAGCTAMQANYIPRLWTWLNPEAKPVLVQLPKDQYLKFQKQWNLPEITP